MWLCTLLMHMDEEGGKCSWARGAGGPGEDTEEPHVIEIASVVGDLCCCSPLGDLLKRSCPRPRTSIVFARGWRSPGPRDELWHDNRKRDQAPQWRILPSSKGATRGWEHDRRVGSGARHLVVLAGVPRASPIYVRPGHLLHQAGLVQASILPRSSLS